MKDILRDSSVGQIVNWLSNGKVLPYDDQRPGYVIPDRYLSSFPPSNVDDSDLAISSGGRSPAETLVNTATSRQELELDVARLEKGLKLDSEKTIPASNPFLVDWDGPDDPENPRNWSKGKRLFVSTLICVLTFAMYIGSAIYTSSIPSIMEHFGVGHVVATLGLSLFVLAYGISPLLLTPMQDAVKLGRNPVYLACIVLFAFFQMPILLAKNIGTILVFRFITGLLSGPSMATGPASLMDLWPATHAAYAIGTWGCAASLGPIMGPIMSSYAAMERGWRWPIYVLLWLASSASVILLFLLPETLGTTVLARRAKRLRKLTGNPHLKSQGELDEAGLSMARVTLANFVTTIKVSAEPAVLFANTYLGFCYALFYLWFESFPLTYMGIHRFNLGESGLPYITFIAAMTLGCVIYISYRKYHINRRIANDANFAPENNLEIALIGGVIMPVSVFAFGWSARASVHWIWPTIAAGPYMIGLFFVFQGILMYLAVSYPTTGGAVLAGNNFARSAVASVFPLFGTAFFHNLGLGGGCSLLGGIGLLMLPFLYTLIKYGAKLRARSRWTK